VFFFLKWQKKHQRFPDSVILLAKENYGTTRFTGRIETFSSPSIQSAAQSGGRSPELKALYPSIISYSANKIIQLKSTSTDNSTIVVADFQNL